MNSSSKLCGPLRITSRNPSKTHSFFIALLILCFVSFHPVAAHAKNNLEELIIWKLSDELKLPAETEKKFTEALRKYNDKKNEFSQIIEGQIQILRKVPSDKERQIWLERYRKTLVDFNAIILSEHDDIRKILGDEKFVKYLELKSDLSSRIKNLMLSKEQTPNEAKGAESKNKK